MTLPTKSIDQIETKIGINDEDGILILDKISGEARLASKEELRGEKGDIGLTGLKGEKGKDGENPEFRKSSTHIQYRLVGDTNWNDLVLLTEIQGLPGSNGADGTNGSDGLNGTDGSSIQSITRTSGTGVGGTTDTYTITLTNGDTTFFQVYNGKDGEGVGDMLKVNNLSDLVNKAVARTNLGVDSSAEVDTKIANIPTVDISGKVDKISGKGLSTNDFTTSEKTKLAGLEKFSKNYNDLVNKPDLTGIGKINTKTVDEANIANERILVYNSTTDNLEYQDRFRGGGGIETIKIAGVQIVGTEFFEYIADKNVNIGSISISLEIAPTGTDFIVNWYKNGLSVGTSTIATTTTAVNGRYRVKTPLNVNLVDGDVFLGKITQVGSAVAGTYFNCVINIA